MKKSDLVKLQYYGKMLQQMQDNNDEKMLEVISQTFSALATSSPELALSVIDQINSQKDAIENLIEQRELQEKQYIDSVVEAMPDSIVFEEEYN